MKSQDVIVSINGKTIQKGQDLIDMVADSPIGSTLKIGIMRDKKPMTLEVMVADRAKTFADNTVLSQNGREEQGTPQGVEKFGISIGTLSVSDKQSAVIPDWQCGDRIGGSGLVRRWDRAAKGRYYSGNQSPGG